MCDNSWTGCTAHKSFMSITLFTAPQVLCLLFLHPIISHVWTPSLNGIFLLSRYLSELCSRLLLEGPVSSSPGCHSYSLWPNLSSYLYQNWLGLSGFLSAQSGYGLVSFEQITVLRGEYGKQPALWNFSLQCGPGISSTHYSVPDRKGVISGAPNPLPHFYKLLYLDWHPLLLHLGVMVQLVPDRSLKMNEELAPFPALGDRVGKPEEC